MLMLPSAASSILNGVLDTMIQYATTPGTGSQLNVGVPLVMEPRGAIGNAAVVASTMISISLEYTMVDGLAWKLLKMALVVRPAPLVIRA